MKQKLSLAGLLKLEFGTIGLAFERELLKVVENLRNQPNDTGKRSIQLQMDLVPDKETMGPSGTLSRVLACFAVRVKLPPRRSSTITMNVTPDNELLFNDLSPDEPDQMTIDEATGEVTEGQHRK